MTLPVEKRRQWIKSRREQRKLTKYARLRRQFLRYSILLTLLTLSTFALTRMHWYLCQNKNNQGIDITGNFVASDNQLRMALKQGITFTPIFMLNPTELENRVQSLGVVKRAFVRRYAFPYPKLKVDIMEEFPWATLYSAASPSSLGSTRVHTLSLRTPRIISAPSASLASISTLPSAASTRFPRLVRACPRFAADASHLSAPSASLSSISSISSAASPAWASITSRANSPLPTDDLDLAPQFVIAESGRLISIKDFPNVFQPTLKIYCTQPKNLNLNASAVEQWSNWITYISKQMECPVLTIDMRQPHEVKVETSRFYLCLGNPDSGLNRRLYRLASVLEVLATQHKEPVYVNLGLNSNIPIKLAKKLDKAESKEQVSRL